MAFRLLDTNIVSFTMNSHSIHAVYLPHMTGYDLAVWFQTVGELLQGALAANWGPTRRARLEGTLATLLVLESDRTT